MEPKSLSATALQTYEACPARYKAENIDRARSIGGVAAMTGSSVHEALEPYVRDVYINKTHEPSLEYLLALRKLSYVKIFNSFDYETEEFIDGYNLLNIWFARTVFDFEVVSVEIKKHFMVPTSAGPLQFNYIMDRVDKLDDVTYRVTDYKTNRWGLRASDLKKKIQARVYALALAIELKTEGIPYERIWVEFDLLRHERVGIVFTREEITATWNYICASAQAIVDTPDDMVEEKLNDMCLFCVRKVSCEALKKNVSVGGVHSFSSVEDAVNERAAMEWQMKGLAAAAAEMDKKILNEMRERDINEVETESTRMFITVSRQRAIDPIMTELAVGPKVFEKYGGKKITMGMLDKMLKSPDLTPEQKAQVRGLIYYTDGEPKIKTEAKSAIDDS